MQPIRLAFVDDHPTLLAGLTTLFATARYEIAGTGATARDMLQLAERHPDVVVADLSMPGEVIPAIACVARTTKVVVFTAYADTDLAMRAIEAGAMAFVLKGRPASDLTDAIEAVQKGDTFISPDFAPRLFTAIEQRSRRRQELKSAALSSRERQIVDGLLRAKTNKEIARELNLSEKTVKHYMTNLMGKLSARNRLEVVLAVQALTNGGEAGQPVAAEADAASPALSVES